MREQSREQTTEGMSDQDIRGLDGSSPQEGMEIANHVQSNPRRWPGVACTAAAAAALYRAASGESEEATAVIRLTAGEYVGVEILPSILADFTLTHPQIEIELSLTNRNVDLLRRDTEIAIRMVRPTQKALIARLIGSCRWDYTRIAAMPKRAVCRQRRRRLCITG